jgi:hypothetical protein
VHTNHTLILVALFTTSLLRRLSHAIFTACWLADRAGVPDDERDRWLARFDAAVDAAIRTAAG